MVWTLLLTVPAHDRLRELAHRQLVNQAARHRGPAFTYLTTRYPAEAESLLSRYRGDADPELLVAIGWYLEPRQDGSSVDAWVDALRYPMTRDVFDEALLAILNTAEERHLRRLKDVARHSPYRPQVLELTSEVKDRIRRRGSRG
jgi:hypothetical protein